MGGVVNRHSLYGFVCGLTLIIFLHLTAFKGIIEIKTMKPSHNSENEEFEKRVEHRIPRILCWIATMPANYKNRTVEVKETWGPNCDVILFFSEKSNVTIPVVGLGIPEGRKYLINKTIAALSYIYQNYYDKADWFLKADDDTYVFVDNLRHFLSMKDPDAPFYYGSTFSVKNATYNSGGGGYVFGKRVLQKIVLNKGKTEECTFNTQAEDKRVGQCLASLGVIPGDSTDGQGLEVFHWSSISMFGRGPEEAPGWAYRFQSLWNSQIHKVSNVSATFHYMQPNEMRVFHYLTKLLKVVGHHRHKWY